MKRFNGLGIRVVQTLTVASMLLGASVVLVSGEAVAQDKKIKAELNKVAKDGAAKVAKEVKAKPKPKAAKTSGDRPGSIQAGIQNLAQRLVGGLERASKAGFRRMAVLPFDSIDKKAKKHKLGRVSSELLSSRLSREPKILQVERARLEAVIGELERSERGELSSDGAVSVGKLLGANNVVIGSIAVAGPDYLLTARVVDSETGRVVTAADQVFPQAGMVALSEDMVEIKSKTGAAIRSAVFPGWGQLYNGATGRGIFYGAAFLGTAAGAIMSAVLGKQAQDDYTSTDPIEQEANVARRKEANGHYERANYLMAGIGAIWALAVSDAYITGVDAAKVNVSIGEGGESAALIIGGEF